MTPPRWSLRRRLAGLVAVNGLLLLVLVALSALLVPLLGGASMGGDLSRFGEYFGWRLYDARDRPADLARERERLRTLFDADVTLFTPDGTFVASTVEPPPRWRPDGRDGTWTERGVRFALRDRGLIVAVGLVRPPVSGPLGLGTVAVIGLVALVVLVSLSGWLALRIASPLERIARAAESLGRGDTSVRVGEVRGELGEVARAFDVMAERIEALVHAQRDLLASLSHELRTPLARARVVLEIAEGGDGERAKRGLAEVADDLSELERLVEATLDAARVEIAAGRAPGGAPRPELATIDVAALLDAARARFARAYPSRAVTIAPAHAGHALGDRALVLRALDNLLDNARKYSSGPIRIGAQPVGDGVELWVDDEGTGIDDDDRARALEPGFRGRNALSTSGAGLGLALAGRLAQACGGSVRLAARDGGGTRAIVRLPRA